jgi:hypothetical protein
MPFFDIEFCSQILEFAITGPFAVETVIRMVGQKEFEDGFPGFQNAR